MTTKGVSFSSLPSSSDRSSLPKAETQDLIQQAAGPVFRACSYLGSWFSLSTWRQTFTDLASPYDVDTDPCFASAEDFEQQVQAKIAEQRTQQPKIVKPDAEDQALVDSAKPKPEDQALVDSAKPKPEDQALVDSAKPKPEEEARSDAIIAVLQQRLSMSDEELQKQYTEAFIKHGPEFSDMDVVKSLAQRAGVPDDWCFPSKASPVEASSEVAPEIEGEESEAEETEKTTQDSSSSSESALVPVSRSEPTSELPQSDQSPHKKPWNLTLGKVVKFVTYGGILLLVVNSLGGLGVGATTTPATGNGTTSLVPTTSWGLTRGGSYMSGSFSQGGDDYGMPILNGTLCIPCIPGGFDPSSLGSMPIIELTTKPGTLPDTSPIATPSPLSPIPTPPSSTTYQSSGSGTETPHGFDDLEVFPEEPLDEPLPLTRIETTGDTGASTSTTGDTGASTSTTGDTGTPPTGTETPTSTTTQNSGWGLFHMISSGANLLGILWNVRQKGRSALLSWPTLGLLISAPEAFGMGSPLLAGGNLLWEGAKTGWAAGTAMVGTPAMLLGTGVAATAAAFGAKKALRSPEITAKNEVPDMVTWKKPGVVTRSGYIYDIEVRGHKDLTEAQRDKLFDAFQEEMLEKYDRPIRIGDKLEFRIPPNETGKWNATLTPGKGNSTLYDLRDPTALTYVHSYTPSIASSESVEKLDFLRDAMVRGSSAISITCIQAPTVFPVSFTNADPSFSSAMQRLLSIPEMRKRMEKSKHPELKKIAEEYRAMMERTKPRQPIDLSALEAQVKTNSKSSPAGIVFGRDRWVGEDRPINLKDGHKHDSDDWAIAIFRLMSSKGDEVEDLFARQLHYDASKTSTRSALATLWDEDGDKPSEAYHRLSITPPPAKADSLPKLVKDKLTASGKTTQFDKAPDFIPIHLEGPITSRDVPMDDLQINSQHIKDSDQSVWYRLDTFSNDDSTITYRTTIEIENGIPQKRYWKIDPKTHADPERITLDQFKKAASTGRDFIYLKQSEKNRVSASAIFKKDFVTKEIDPKLGNFPITNPTSSSIPVTSISFEYDYVDPIPEIDAAARKGDDGSDLYRATYKLLEQADRDKQEITIPVPAGQEPNGRNWPIGMILLAVNAYIEEYPNHFKSVKLAIRRDETIERPQLIQAIKKADEIVQGAPDFDTFSREWAKASKPKRKGRFW